MYDLHTEAFICCTYGYSKRKLVCVNGDNTSLVRHQSDAVGQSPYVFSRLCPHLDEGTDRQVYGSCNRNAYEEMMHIFIFLSLHIISPPFAHETYLVLRIPPNTLPLVGDE